MTVRLPVSVKGVVFDGPRVWLRYNERHEWELPGGRLDPDEQPVDTVVREIREELGLEVTVQRLIGAHRYTIAGSADEHTGVLVLGYLCAVTGRVGDVEAVGEAGLARFQRWPVAELRSLPMPAFYSGMIYSAAIWSAGIAVDHPNPVPDVGYGQLEPQPAAKRSARCACS